MADVRWLDNAHGLDVILLTEHFCKEGLLESLIVFVKHYLGTRGQHQLAPNQKVFGVGALTAPARPISEAVIFASASCSLQVGDVEWARLARMEEAWCPW